MEIRSENSKYIFPLDDDKFYRGNITERGNNQNAQFIRTRNIDKEINRKLWDNIALTEKEEDVIEALKIIEPLELLLVPILICKVVGLL